jgi:hypothetical protein
MAQSGFTPIQLYYSSTTTNVPLAANLAAGELAINTNDGKLFYKDSSGVVQTIATKATAANSFSAGSTGFTPSTATTGAVTLAGTLITSNGGTGLASYTAGDTTYYASGTALTKLAIGASGTIKTSTGTAPQWVASLNTSQGGTGLTTYTAGDLSYYATGTTLTKLGIGTSGQFLTSTGTAPQWSTLSGVAVTTFSAGTTGLTPSSATSGAITLAGTLITSNGGTGLTTYTAGDTFYYASGTAYSKLAIGAAGTIKTSTGSAPQWVASLNTTQGGTGLTSYTAGDLTYYATGSVLSKLGIGTSGQILTSSGTAPQWSTLTGVAVTTFQTSLGGLTPATASSGAITLAGTLNTTSGGTGLTSYTAGDLVYYATGSVLSKLGIGTTNYVLTSSGTAPQYVAQSTLSVGTATNVAGGTTGAVHYQSGAGATTFLTLGTTNYVLTAGASAPQYVAQSTLSVGSATTATTATNLAGGAAGSLPYNTASATTTYLGIGSSGTVLTSSGTAPQWSASLNTSQGGTGLTTFTAGDLVYFSTGTSFTKLGIGTAGQILTVNSGATAPQWSTASPTGVTSISFGSTGLTPSTATTGAVTVAGTLALASGGTGATTVSGAQTNLQVDPAGTAVAMAIALG